MFSIICCVVEGCSAWLGYGYSKYRGPNFMVAAEGGGRKDELKRVLESKEASMVAGKGYVIICALDDFKKGCWKIVSGCSVW